MNARSEIFEITLEGCQIEECISSVFHTLLLHRTLGKFHYQCEGNYSIGTVGTVDVECTFVNLTYVRANSDQLSQRLKNDISSFRDALRYNEGQTNGQIRLEFFERHPRQSFLQLGDNWVPWEIWDINLDVVQVATESEHQRLREEVGEKVSEIILNSCSSINRTQYVPKMPQLSEVKNVFDTSFIDVQPYLFKVSHNTTGAKDNQSMGSTMRKIIRDTLSL